MENIKANIATYNTEIIISSYSYSYDNFSSENFQG
jgi:hypothetical protein